MKRVAIGSFGAGLVGAALYLGAAALWHARVRCETPGQAECAFDEETAHEVARMQALGALGCALAGGGALLWLRSSTSHSKET